MNIKVLSVFIFCLAIVSIGNAQTKSDVFRKDTKITWLGVDFTGATFLGDRQRLGSESDLKFLIEQWNEIFLKEPSKFNVARAIDKTRVENAIEITKEHNAELDVISMYSELQKDFLHLKKEDIEEIISKYDYQGKGGIGLMFNVESFSKMNSEASVWVTFIDLDAKEVMFTERMSGSPAGFGLRNFWANSLFEILEKIKKKEFDNWKKKYFRP